MRNQLIEIEIDQFENRSCKNGINTPLDAAIKPQKRKTVTSVPRACL